LLFPFPSSPRQLQKSRILPEDPMAAYMMEKQEKAMAASGKPQRRRYQGQAPPNRFNVAPGALLLERQS
jgi:hypothetical protein